MYKIVQNLIYIVLIISCISCDELVKSIDNEQVGIVENDARQSTNTSQIADQPARKNFTDKHMSFKGAPLRFTKHGRCRSVCRFIDPFEIQEVINQGHINKRKTNYKGKPCPAIAYEGKTSDGQFARVVVGDCAGDYKVITVIDLSKDWDCNCK